MKTTCAVVVVYEDDLVREIAVDFCDHLIKRFWRKCSFDVTWWSFRQLSDGPANRQAMDRSRSAEFIVLAFKPDGPIGSYIQAWLETSLRDRGEREGALVGLSGTSAGANERVLEKHAYLRNLAHRAGLDYLTCVPEDIGYETVDSWQSCTERAGQVTSVLREILEQRESRHSTHSSHFDPQQSP